MNRWSGLAPADQERMDLLAREHLPTECWRWRWQNAGKRPYARTSEKHGKNLIRILAETPPGLETRHTCGHDWCVNPSHLTPGTTKENAEDRMSHGTNAEGERNGRASISAADAAAIRADNRSTISALAQLYGISRRQVSRIKRGESW